MALSLSGCASVFGKKSKQVSFDTNPEGADVYIDGFRIGKTPVSVNLPLNVNKSDLDLYRRKSAKKKLRAERRSGRKTDEVADSILVIKNQYKVVIVKEGFKTIQFFISPTQEFATTPNRGLCAMDAAMSVLTFGIPMVVNSARYSCSGFENVYHFDLYNGSSGTIPSRDSFAHGSLSDSLTLGGGANFSNVANSYDS